MKFICYGSLTWLIQLERELFSLEFCIYIWYKITRGIFNVTTREMSFMRLKHSYHDKGIRNLCKWNFWTFHIGKDREDCVTWSHFFKKKTSDISTGLLRFYKDLWSIHWLESHKYRNHEWASDSLTHIFSWKRVLRFFQQSHLSQLWDKVREQESRAGGRQRTIKIYPRLCMMISREPEVVSGWMKERFKRQNFALLIISVSITIYKIFLIWTEFESI